MAVALRGWCYPRPDLPGGGGAAGPINPFNVEEIFGNLVEKMEQRKAEIPPRPEGVDPATFHGSQFEKFDEIAEKYGFDDLNPAVVHAPIFLFARAYSTTDPCYPEGALNLTGDGPNPGTKTSASPNPGADCRNPGPYTGAYSKGDSFPVYVSAAYCPDKQGRQSEGEWRINYDVYYVHDGNSLLGQKHDWEGVTLVFKTDRNHPNENWYMASAVIFHRYDKFDRYKWKEVETASGEEDVKKAGYRALKKHPKVYVGVYSHSAFHDKCDASVGCPRINEQKGMSDMEYRSDDWYRIVNSTDLYIYKTVHGDWNYGKATSTPWFNHNNMCSFG